MTIRHLRIFVAVAETGKMSEIGRASWRERVYAPV